MNRTCLRNVPHELVTELIPGLVIIPPHIHRVKSTEDREVVRLNAVSARNGYGNEATLGKGHSVDLALRDMYLLRGRVVYDSPSVEETSTLTRRAHVLTVSYVIVRLDTAGAHRQRHTIMPQIRDHKLTRTLTELRRTKTKTKRLHCSLTEAPRSDVRKPLVTKCQVGLCGP